MVDYHGLYHIHIILTFTLDTDSHHSLNMQTTDMTVVRENVV